MSEFKAQFAYATAMGRAYRSSTEDFMLSRASKPYRGSGKLIVTSPPFPLKKKKAYGNLEGEQYLDWISEVLTNSISLLADDGSLVVEIGNAWDPGQPTMSTLPLKSLLAIAERADLQVCQQFVCHNPARLPGPAQWVNIERRRVKDSFTHVWWFAKDSRVAADNRKVVQEYSPSMQRLLKSKKYNSGKRPSGWDIGEESFLTDHGGAIPGNVLTYANTSDDPCYRHWCREVGVPVHPARMQRSLVEFFLEFLTEPDDLVIDVFAGSNVVGSVAERLGRKWLSIERSEEYLVGSMGRFQEKHNRLTAKHEPFRQFSRAMKTYAK